MLLCDREGAPRSVGLRSPPPSRDKRDDRESRRRHALVGYAQQAALRGTAKRFSPIHQMWSTTFDAGKLHVRFDERDLETETWSIPQTPATERAGQQVMIAPTSTAPDLDSTRRPLSRICHARPPLATLHFWPRFGGLPPCLDCSGGRRGRTVRCVPIAPRPGGSSSKAPPRRCCSECLRDRGLR